MLKGECVRALEPPIVTDKSNGRRAKVSQLTRCMVIAGPLAMLASSPARSNPDWPDRPITMLHGFPPGGPTDLVARIVADGLTRRPAQRIVLETKPAPSRTTSPALAP